MQICCTDLTSLRNSKEEKETHKVYFGWNCVISLIWCLFSLAKWHSVPFSPDSVLPAQGVETCLFHWTDLIQDKEYQLWIFDIHLELFVPLVNYYLPLKGRGRKQIVWRRVHNNLVSLPSFLDRLLHVIYIWKIFAFLLLSCWTQLFGYASDVISIFLLSWCMFTIFLIHQVFVCPLKPYFSIIL